ncbi:hypothetical protein FSW04_18915 [Baekduia soli]|uniref:Uncharacterized protein n=1 Tax=Baekduia soli TaxID=496014 RepID=A0A5B8U8Z8_9ACTN|nr:hypothetical protein [Baekduia soli]QEC49437.1 hypothetical protein FSW04_18915 [Baekduia soli]
MPGFTPDDIEPLGRVPDSTALDFAVTRNGQALGQVRVASAHYLALTGQDVRAYVAERLTHLEAHIEPAEFESALQAVLDL